ncbi:MAG: hypothetical protein PHE12_03215, partial [Clostridia bacterium]|nr:hypothetical protein [Clostridia bacterium]
MKREEITQSEKWNLEDIFTDDANWQNAFEELKQNADICLKYKGKLTEPDAIFNCLQDSKKLYIMAEKLFAYARLKHDENTKNAECKSLNDKIENLYVKVMANNSFIVPSLSKLSSGFLRNLANDKKFAEYDYFLIKLIEQKKHILSDKEEHLLAQGGEIYGSFSDIFS